MRSFDHKLRVDRRFRRAQIRDEIVESLLGILGIGLANTVFGMLQIHGYSRLYHSMNDGPSLWYEVMQYPLAMFLTETGVYWLHRMFHLPVLYSYTHKSHHRFVNHPPLFPQR
ncbi:hypothetical protein H113_00896 [Trichophyton rubrum MR1459]|uniref:Fatty acid hydroxylase domain-containing protein n=2 Tax=Trichophyton TaxID=5550 RepID=A0A080WRE7_TRIRC|nr:uncharacterized protein TERG_12626 [Trichophyton rubrum CBS 118892]EZF78052.1 hypothetical protein H105_00894 [Trichophyton soudanense CBS 452.61]EZF88675.1 hypothetical protein H110_00895 [Trichophyton rubrum MR1448]EZF99463.1 hypothetical protein H113_00896 [Trichophyton rubrum MR1459]EZG10659.1 hypothetical protein H106_00693 [Trichophyton rubrum CBS 735.88]KFL62925.1 hypothetical protein TERG_12626 [Trichophyton rubrum CBS 118892]